MLWAERLGRFEIDMALEHLQFAPVMTPRTLEELARILREGERRDVAKIASDLIPVVQGVVDNFFKPMSQVRNEKAFWEDFDTFSREFEPYRLYINIRLLQTLDPAKLLESYTEVFLQLSEGLLHSADEKGIPVERLKKILTDYVATISNLVKRLANLGGMGMPASVQELNLADCIHSATRLDYGLTALFLILEGTIPTPSMPIPALLVDATEDSLDHFNKQWEALARVSFPQSEMHKPSAEADSARTQELQWVRDHSTVLRDLAGKWVVVEGDRLVASDPQYETAREMAVHKGIVRPFIIYVPESVEGAFMGL